ncbi:hypothetical protein Tco_1002024 [Tanacetum coccineum]|uniref:Uncharacterized protein n=1 Tax=Tanacetum coccineum TaxID=301880 RepID=A0ABQ5F548_9ASTR
MHMNESSLLHPGGSPFLNRVTTRSKNDQNHEVPVPEMFHELTDDELTEEKIKQMEAIWIKLLLQMMKVLMLEFSIEEGDKLFNEMGRFTSMKGIDESYYHLKYNKKEVDDLRAEQLAKSHDPLALMANSNNPAPNYLIAQPGMNMGQDRQMQMVGGNGGNQFRQYAGQNNIRNQNRLIVIPGIANQIPNGNGNVVAARAEGNAIGNNGNQIRCYNYRGLGHLARNCTQAIDIGSTQTDEAPPSYDQTDHRLGVRQNAKTKRPQPRSNTKNDRVPFTSKSSCSKNNEIEVEDHPRNLLLSKNKKHMSSECIRYAVTNSGMINLKLSCAICKQCLITANHDVCVLNYVNDMNSRDETGLVYDKEEGTVMFKQDDEKITFKMPHTMEIFKETRLMGLSTDSIPPFTYEENFSHGRTHYCQSLFIGDDYMQDEGDTRGIRHLMRLEREMMRDKGEVT